MANWRVGLRMLPVLCVALGTLLVVARAARSPLRDPVTEVGVAGVDLQPTVQQVDRCLIERWLDAKVTPATVAPDLQILRRLSLALHGTVPALEEIREFEADTRHDRLEHWTRRMLADKRFADYFAERLARGYVGTEGGQFVVYRRDRFVAWLSEELQKNTPYDQLVRTMISGRGLWTGQPSVNFVTAAANEGTIDCNKLAGKTVRAFLGQRIDCAQCHDHPFAQWKQGDFEGLAAYYGQAQVSIVGLEDKLERDGKPVEFSVMDRKTLENNVIQERVPFLQQDLPAEGSRRERLAAWITHADNRRFERAIANRVWGLMFGRAYQEPVDDLPDPPDKDETDLLSMLGKDFRAHGCDLRRLIQVIAASRAFRLDSVPSSAEKQLDDAAKVRKLEEAWAMFPLIRLRPEQVIGSIQQCSTVQITDQNAHLFLRTIRFTQSRDFVKEYGDFGEDELKDRGGTIPQRLLLMNGQLASEAIKPGPLSSVGQVVGFSASDEICIDNAFLICLTRRPNPEEREYFLSELKQSTGARDQALEDLFWSLFNSTEFAWSH